MKLQFKSFPMDSNWVSGLVNDGEYHFEAKLFDESSEYGITQNGFKGRVSKLNISIGDRWSGWNSCICNYDRGWDVLPRNIEVFEEIMSFLEESPKRFV